MTENEIKSTPVEPVEAEIVDSQEEAEASIEAEQPGLDESQLLRQELEELRTQADEYLDGWQRSRAEFANYKKRVEREQAQVYQVAAGNIVKRYLDVLDDLERALKNRPSEGDGVAWAGGIELIYRKIQAILENEGVKPMDTDGQLFDPNLHEAISSEPSDEHESGEIIEVLQQGYMLGERVLRPAVVRVAS
jgi:molecular chaperone GrpE